MSCARLSAAIWGWPRRPTMPVQRKSAWLAGRRRLPGETQTYVRYRRRVIRWGGVGVAVSARNAMAPARPPGAHCVEFPKLMIDNPPHRPALTSDPAWGPVRHLPGTWSASRHLRAVAADIPPCWATGSAGPERTPAYAVSGHVHLRKQPGRGGGAGAPSCGPQAARYIVPAGWTLGQNGGGRAPVSPARYDEPVIREAS